MAAELSERAVRRLADPLSFERGEAYFTAGRVRRVTVDGSAARAVVDGTRAYRVRLDLTRRGLRGRCSCPYGAEGVFCKHCVAAALTWLQQGGDVAEPRRKPLSDKRLRSFLDGCDQSWLVDQLIAAATSDRILRARLEVAAGADDAFDDRDLRERLELAIEIGDYVEYGAAYGYFRQVDEALDAVAELVDGGFPDAAITLAEYALELLEDAAERVDDSDGGLCEAIAHAEDVHLAACEAGAPGAVELAERLVARALESDYEVFLDALPAYARVLGAAGVARYREMVEREWQALPPRQPNDYGGRRFTITHLMETLAESTGEADAVVDVLARDAISGYDVLRIAERLCVEGRDEEALGWLERGLADFEPDDRLRALAAEIHLRAGRRARAGEMLWANFVDRPTLVSYHALRDATAEEFPPWRERALAALTGMPSGRSTLVEILLNEGDADGAWQAAMDAGCAEDLRLRVARARAKTHPADAIPVLLRLADRTIERRDRASYRAAADLLAEAGQLSTRCGAEAEFRDHLTALRHTHRTKWALRQELDQARLP